MLLWQLDKKPPKVFAEWQHARKSFFLVDDDDDQHNMNHKDHSATEESIAQTTNLKVNWEHKSPKNR
jgi:hypothetical protein